MLASMQSECLADALHCTGMRRKLPGQQAGAAAHTVMSSYMPHHASQTSGMEGGGA